MDSVLHAYKDISILTILTIFGSGLSFIAQVIFARNLSIIDYGVLSSSIVAVTLLIPLAGFGVGQYWLRIFGLEGWGAKRWLKPSLKFVLLSSSLSFSFLIAAVLFNPSLNLDVLIIWIAPLVLAMAIMELVIARYQLEERFLLVAYWQLLPHLGRISISLILMFIGGGLYFIGIGFFILSLIIVCFGCFSLYRMLDGRFRLVGHKVKKLNKDMSSPNISLIPKNSWPFAFAGLFYLIYFQTDILLLNWLIGAEAAAIYNVAFTVMIGIYLIPGVVYQKYLLPKQHRWAEHNLELLLEVYRYGCGLMLVLGLILMIIIGSLCFWFVPLIFGYNFNESAFLVLILSICIPFKFLATNVGSLLTVQDHMRSKVKYMGLVAGINLILNLILIPNYSYYGAALATVISEISLLIIYLFAVSSRLFGADALRGWTFKYKGKEFES